MSARLQPKTTNQVRAIFGLARKNGLDEELLHDTVESVTKRTRSIAALTFREAEAIIAHLKGDSFTPTPRRTVQHRRMRAGINQVVQQGQLELIASLASQRHWSAETLEKFCRRQCGHFPLRTTSDANKVIEALKSMNKREGLWAA
ncbi:MAG: DUF1018 domain-containing protein [Pyrinomonadaceae bacterium]|nr:DUF1018 domain-containing protein [Pyrinomonadaceae bacterium]